MKKLIYTQNPVDTTILALKGKEPLLCSNLSTGSDLHYKYVTITKRNIIQPNFFKYI